MLPSLLLALAARQTPTQTPAPLPAQTNPFSIAQLIPEPRRLELTPTIDGKLDTDEWDELFTANGMTAYFQYEPGKYHLAASLPAGQDLVVSMDLRSDGWLVGDDNVEIRVHVQDGKPTLMVRELDGTQKAGPRWEDNPGFAQSSVVAASAGTNGNIVEITLIDPGSNTINPKPGQKPSVRFDAVPSDAPMAEPYIPRVLAPLHLVTERGTALPDGLKWTVQSGNRTIVAGESTRLRFTFNGTNELGVRRIATRGEGPLKEAVNTIEKPFPSFDNKKRAFVDYDTAVAKDAPQGYHTLRSALTFDKGPEAVLQSSVKVGQIVDFDLVPSDIKASDKPQDARMNFYIHSNSTHKISGKFQVVLPPEFSIKNGGAGDFTIYDRGESALRRSMEVIIPNVKAGTYPVQFNGTVDGKPVTGTAWITVFEK